MKTVRDQLTGKDIAIDFHPSSATAIMCCNGVWLQKTILNGSRSLAQVAFTKGDLNSFGSFFDE